MQDVDQQKPRLRDHSRFWLILALMVIIGVLGVVIAYQLAGTSVAAGILAAELAFGMLIGLR